MANQRAILAAGVALMGARAVAFGVPPTPAPGPSTGYDVVMSGIGSASAGNTFGDVNPVTGNAVTSHGQVGGVSAFSVGTISCNVGNADAPWFEATNQHPVFASSIYRLRLVDGAWRFEQVGIGWAKHGFCGSDQARCTDLVVPTQSPFTQPDCDGLGPFRTDYYGAALNAAQSGLGPRSEVNPWTGGFAYPYGIGWAQTGDLAYKRIQVPTAALSPADVYVFEAAAVIPDEPVANRVNNFACRRASWDGSAFTLTGPTYAMQAALTEYARAAPGVLVSSAEPLAGADGRVMLASNATPITGGQWRYEYTLLNVNLNARIAGVRVWCDARGAVSGVGFHAPAAHSGEVSDNAPWNGGRQGMTVSWSAHPGVNGPTSTNAIVWGSAYTFRFDSDLAPTTGVLSGETLAGAVGFVMTARVPGAPMPGACVADLTGDGRSDTADLVALLGVFGSAVTPGCCGDLSGDGVVSTPDLVAFLGGFGCV